MAQQRRSRGTGCRARGRSRRARRFRSCQARTLKASGSLKVPVENWSDLDDVAQVLELPVGGEAAGVVVVEDVEARQLGERHPLVEHRVGLAAEHLDVVAQVDQRLGEVAGVDALAADVGLAPVA